MNARHRIGADIPTRLTPTLAIRARTAADAFDISLNTFLALVREGKMPKPISIPGHAGLALYDFEAVREAWDALKEQAGADDKNDFD